MDKNTKRIYCPEDQDASSLSDLKIIKNLIAPSLEENDVDEQKVVQPVDKSVSKIKK